MDFTTSNGMKVEQDDACALTGRAGLVLGKKWDLSEDRYFQPYLKGGVNHEFMGDQKVTVNGIAFSDDLRGTRLYYTVRALMCSSPPMPGSTRNLNVKTDTRPPRPGA